jgi:hypothetical protein
MPNSLAFITRIAALAATFLAAAGAFAAETGPPRLASFTFDNDFLVGFDRHYTSGMQLAFPVDRAGMPSFLQAAPPIRWSIDPQVILAIGHRTYTPDDTDVATPDPGDRPYAGWLYLLADARIARGDAVDYLSATIGVVGRAALAKQFQSASHHLFQAGVSKGWDTQVGDELTVSLAYERSWPAVMATGLAGRTLDLSVRAGATLGTPFTHAGAGAMVRYGSNLPEDLPAAAVSLGPPRDGYRGASKFGWYAWAGVDARAVAYNVFLQGNTFHDDHLPIHKKTFNYDVQGGAALAWPTARVGFTYILRSREFDGQRGPDRFGQIAVSFPY